MQLFGAARAQIGLSWVPFVPDKRYQLLAHLAYQDDWLSRDRLAYLFWPDTDTHSARQNLRGLLQRVRALDWLTGLETDIHQLRWRVDTDVAAFKHAAQGGKVDEALALCGGSFLAGLDSDEAPEFTNWLELEREHLQSTWPGRTY